jgi:hypothetical protein
MLLLLRHSRVLSLWPRVSPQLDWPATSFNSSLSAPSSYPKVENLPFSNGQLEPEHRSRHHSPGHCRVQQSNTDKPARIQKIHRCRIALSGSGQRFAKCYFRDPGESSSTRGKERTYKVAIFSQGFEVCMGEEAHRGIKGEIGMLERSSHNALRF